MLGEAGRDTLILGPGNDFADGDSASMTYAGASNAYDDFINGGEGNDTMFGDGGADVLIGGAGNDGTRK